ncbi:hypothetical protein R3P38DRAFT_3360199 [Favolaschia claudopus]|uniref:Uncharacterized protein n=1 Tax=Favolaschia claudopus TaxID=2862362 RepID=A0AAW0AZG8_9AGAR
MPTQTPAANSLSTTFCPPSFPQAVALFHSSLLNSPPFEPTLVLRLLLSPPFHQTQGNYIPTTSPATERHRLRRRHPPLPRTLPLRLPTLRQLSSKISKYRAPKTRRVPHTAVTHLATPLIASASTSRARLRPPPPRHDLSVLSNVKHESPAYAVDPSTFDLRIPGAKERRRPTTSATTEPWPSTTGKVSTSLARRRRHLTTCPTSQKAPTTKPTPPPPLPLRRLRYVTPLCQETLKHPCALRPSPAQLTPILSPSLIAFTSDSLPRRLQRRARNTEDLASREIN